MIIIYIIIPKDEEEFRAITYSGVKEDSYMISNYGKVFSKISNRYLTAYTDTKGYQRVVLSRNNKRPTNFKVHRLVAWEFCPGYDELTERVYPNHKDSNRQYNYYENLEWVTSSENSRHAFKDGMRSAKKGTNHYANKYSPELVSLIKNLLTKGYSRLEIMNELGYNQCKDNIRLANLIHDIKRGKTWKDEEGSTTIENNDDMYVIDISL